uniref:Salivary lipocalin n=1 Tax=Ornithodoros coriaceus TaxID=92741 RepID=B2D265_ORNCO|nr:salivary lipocalin [Ornithodoros coriaceus]
MIQLTTLLTVCVSLGIARGEDCKSGQGASEVLTALSTEVYFLTGTTDLGQPPCRYMTANDTGEGCESGATKVTYGHKKGSSWVSFIQVVNATGDTFSASTFGETSESTGTRDSGERPEGPLNGMAVLVQGKNCFVLKKDDVTELWVTKDSADGATCCKWSFEKDLNEKHYQTTYEPGVC